MTKQMKETKRRERRSSTAAQKESGVSPGDVKEPVEQSDPPLENDHNVYILGAGFSQAAGLPLMRTFLNEMRDARAWLTKQERKEEAKAIARVLRFRLRAAAAAYRVPIDLENIEHLFSLGIATPGEEGLEDALKVSIAATLDYSRAVAARREIRVSYKGDSRPILARDEDEWVLRSPIPKGQPIYGAPEYDWIVGTMCGRFGSNPDATKNTIITFNYDTLVEESLMRMGVPVAYGFGPRAADNRISVNRSNMSLRSGKGKTSILKLHGSVNWGKRRDSKGGAGRSLAVYDSYAALRNDSSGVQVPMIIPPTWRKVFSGDHTASIWKEAVAAVETATRIVMIGFSIPKTDIHFKYLLASGLMSNISLRGVILIDPLAEESVGDNLAEVLRSDVSCLRRPKEVEKYFETSAPHAELMRPLASAWRRLPK